MNKQQVVVLMICRTVTMQLHIYANTSNNVHYLDGTWTPSTTARLTLALAAISDASGEKQSCQYISIRHHRFLIRQHPQRLITDSSQVCHRGLGLSLIMEVRETATGIGSLKPQFIRMFVNNEYIDVSLQA